MAVNLNLEITLRTMFVEKKMELRSFRTKTVRLGRFLLPRHPRQAAARFNSVLPPCAFQITCYYDRLLVFFLLLASFSDLKALLRSIKSLEFSRNLK